MKAEEIFRRSHIVFGIWYSFLYVKSIRKGEFFIYGKYYKVIKRKKEKTLKSRCINRSEKNSDLKILFCLILCDLEQL